MNDTTEDSLLDEHLVLSSDKLIDDEGYLFPEGYCDLFDSLETDNDLSNKVNPQDIPTLSDQSIEETTDIEHYSEEELADTSQAQTPDPLNDWLTQDEVHNAPILEELLVEKALDIQNDIEEMPTDISQAKTSDTLLDDDFFSDALLKNDIDILSGTPEVAPENPKTPKPITTNPITTKSTTSIGDELLSKSLIKNNSDAIVCTAMKQLFVLQHLSVTKDKLRYWFGPAKANNDIKEIIFSMDQDIKAGKLKGKPSIIKNSIIRYAKVVSFRKDTKGFKSFSDDFNQASSREILKKITTIEEILGE